MERSAERVGLRRGDVRLLTLPRISASPTSIESRPVQTPEKVLDGLVTEPSVKIGFDIVAGGAVTEVGPKMILSVRRRSRSRRVRQ